MAADQVHRHDPKIDKPARSFSIKDLLNENHQEKKSPDKTGIITPEKEENRAEFTPEAFNAAWQEFVEQLNGEGPRIISMFKSVKTEFEDQNTIKIHFHNATQKDTFVLNYKQRLVNFLERKFIVPELDIQNVVDQSENENVLYSDEQKLNYLFNKYPSLKEMKKIFNLDLP